MSEWKNVSRETGEGIRREESAEGISAASVSHSDLHAGSGLTHKQQQPRRQKGFPSFSPSHACRRGNVSDGQMCTVRANMCAQSAKEQQILM